MRVTNKTDCRAVLMVFEMKAGVFVCVMGREWLSGKVTPWSSLELLSAVYFQSHGHVTRQLGLQLKTSTAVEPRTLFSWTQQTNSTHNPTSQKPPVRWAKPHTLSFTQLNLFIFSILI